MYDNKNDKNSSINIIQNKNDLKTKIQSEINCYEEFEILVHEQLSPLEFYRDNQNIFNKLSHMAKMVFSITSSVASGGTFSNVKKKSVLIEIFWHPSILKIVFLFLKTNDLKHSFFLFFHTVFTFLIQINFN